MKFLVGIDCGHGMTTPGKRTPRFRENIYKSGKLLIKRGEEIHENEWNRAVAKYCVDALKRCNIDYCYVSDYDGSTDTSLSSRANKANSKRCDILVSFHYNAYGSCLGFVDKLGGLLVLRTKNCSDKSIKLGNLIVDELEKAVDYKYSYGLRRDVDISGFTLAILRQTKMPAVLVEYGFMDVMHEALLMRDKNHQKKCGEATAKAICKYFDVPFIDEEQEEFKPIQIKVLSETLNVRAKADWDAKPVTVVKRGQHLDVIDRVDAANGKTDMYKLESGLYITASSTYVEIV